ncbi:hypothetical protein BDV41DRAFT_525904 [Aspergillus transmontanensis]|uniref:Uncharacterized protein n=1 Tax=Aspergillus transmontanensis TaxID=1034304 RepID=A0A5N6W9X0_9EURO|nr:hypothetical protein BDV41DRAFT_525904 [Aspergillus transmontanensis]
MRNEPAWINGSFLGCSLRFILRDLVFGGLWVSEGSKRSCYCILDQGRFVARHAC